MNAKRILRLLLWDILTILTVLLIAAALMTHPATDQSWLMYLWNILKKLTWK